MSKEEDQIERFLVKNTSSIVSLELRYFIFLTTAALLGSLFVH